MKIEIRVILFSVLVGLFIGIFSAAVDYFFFYSGSFLEILITDIPPEEIWKRALALLVCLLFGLIVARVMVHRLKAEHGLTESERQFHLLFEQAPDAIFVLDSEGRFVNCNTAAEQLTGHMRGELTGRSYQDDGLFAPEDHSRAEDVFSRTLAGETTGPTEFTLIGKDGRRIVTETRTYLLRFHNRTLITSIARDITERKRTEQEKKLLEEQLRQAQKMESIGRLAGGIAHDFNNLLTTIIGHAELGMMQQKARGVQTSELQEIISSGHRAAQLTRQLLTFSRKQVIAPIVLNLNDTIVRLGRMLHRLIGEDVRVITNLEADLFNVRADPVQIEQMVMNLAVNARDAMPRGGRLSIETGNVILDEEYARTHAGVKPGPHVMLAISDTGHGMSADVQSHIFEPFFTTKEVGKGTGLGLSTVYGIVNQHGGHIWLYSEEDHGTTFKVYFPAVEAPSETQKLNYEGPEGRHGQETVLLVEDQETVRKLVNRILTEYGYRVLTAKSGPEALEIAAGLTEPIHLLLTDVIMPGMNGRELYEQLSRTNAEMRVIFMSGYTDDVIVHQGMIDAGTTFLQKPISVRSLTRAVREVLDRKVSG